MLKEHVKCCNLYLDVKWCIVLINEMFSYSGGQFCRIFGTQSLLENLKEDR
jgi:hypothetical protein